jgi:hypothetical protein
MTDALKKALEENTLSDGAKAVIQEAWETRLQEAREEIAAQLRDEFALKYEKDKNEIVEAADVMIREAIEAQVKELGDAKKDAMAEKATTKKKMAEALDHLEVFIKEQLTKEVEEFRADRNAVAAKVSTVDKFVTETLTKELEEFHEERRKLAEDRVTHKITAKKELAEAKKKLVSEMAVVCEKFIREHITEEMTQLKGELIEAKKKHFGMKVFEAFAAEFGASFFNERKEVSKLLAVIEEQNQKIEESSKAIATRDKALFESENKYRIAQDRAARTKTMTELLGSLAGSKRKLMEELLEKVPTNKLTESFNAYLPAVIAENKTALNEGKTSSAPALKEVTGDKETLMSKGNVNPESKGVKEILTKFRNMEQHANNKQSVI